MVPSRAWRLAGGPGPEPAERQSGMLLGAPGTCGLRRPERPPSGTVAGMDDDKGDIRTRAIAQLALTVDTGGDVEQAVQAAYMAGVEPHEIAELSGLPMRRALKILGQQEG